MGKHTEELSRLTREAKEHALSTNSDLHQQKNNAEVIEKLYAMSRAQLDDMRQHVGNLEEMVRSMQAENVKLQNAIKKRDADIDMLKRKMRTAEDERISKERELAAKQRDMEEDWEAKEREIAVKDRKMETELATKNREIAALWKELEIVEESSRSGGVDSEQGDEETTPSWWSSIWR